MCGSLGDESGDIISEWYYAYECQWLGCDGQWIMREDTDKAFCPICGHGEHINKPGRKLILVVRIE